MSQQTEVSRKEALAILWQRGKLRWKLHAAQQKMYDSIMSNDREQTVIASSRRLGKSFLMCVIASEVCLQKPNSIVKYVCPRKSQVKVYIKPIMTTIFKDCPPDLKPEFKTNDNMYIFPNGSQIQLAGTDNGHHESLRGGASVLWIVDEAGFCDELKYVVDSILAPTADTTGGRGIIASTPAKQPDHDFNELFYKPAEFKGELLKYTIYDSPLITPDKLEKIISRYRGRENNHEFRREYLCQIIQESELTVIPEFTDEIQKATVKEDYERPAYFDSYVAMDIGVRDFTVVLFGFYDFKNNSLIIEDEYVVNGESVRSDKLAEVIRSKERELWTNVLTNEFKEPYLRISDDNNLILLNDLNQDHGLLFHPTRKDNKRAAINNVRLKMASKQIIIHPRCTTLIYHIKNAIWDKKSDKFAKTADGGHADALDALIYMVRNLVESKNPYPHGYGQSFGDNIFRNPFSKVTEKYGSFKELFVPTKSIKINK